ncbi:hypothetical protein ACVRZC_06100 [Streptococcus hyointestinalis]|uniref:Uncharacterized protein n=1 Tax=Streptococcus hyointestinalis TaxID=1337 RepID=A0A380K1N5_9STRE|nr:hypothetical protein [Streptococcus hyointestinalis]SUN57922.1 Uncharacterised protein [Streptococcus hyointestinalis]
MTAEIAILNKNGVALAADSAVTISSGDGNAKTYNAANKLFSFGENHNIGFMIYGNAEYMDIPWEIIFKEFRNHHKNDSFQTVEECTNRFVEFIKDDKFNTAEIALQHIQSMIYRALMTLTEIANSHIAKVQSESAEHTINNDKIVEILKIVIEKVRMENIDRKSFRCNVEIEDFLEDFQMFCINLLQNHFRIDISNIINDFLTLMYELTIFRNSFENISGIIICGYGQNELFPSLRSFEISYSYRNELKILQKEEVSISTTDCTASITPFAQTDMIMTILKGMDPDMEEVVSEEISNASLTEDEKNSIISRIGSYQKEYFLNPILNITGMLSVSELANMAETLVNLTSFKRHITNSLETVGGPIDVLVISRGDGPIWINRKEYFDIKKNIDYQLRKRGYGNDNDLR